MSMSDLVVLDEVEFGYGERPVVVGLDLAVGGTDFLGIVGPSGSGKTTVLRLLLGSLQPSRGRLRRRPGLAIGYVPQLDTVNWNFPITVEECVVMARTGRRRPWTSRAERAAVAAVLDRLGIGGLSARHIRELSGGQQQRMFIARALLRRPELLLMDEPTSGVDVMTRHDMLHLLADLNAEGTAIVVTTHDLNGVAAHLPRVVALNRTVIAAGTPAHVLRSDVLERTFGAPMEVMEHMGMPVVLDAYRGSTQRSA